MVQGQEFWAISRRGFGGGGMVTGGSGVGGLLIDFRDGNRNVLVLTNLVFLSSRSKYLLTLTPRPHTGADTEFRKG